MKKEVRDFIRKNEKVIDIQIGKMNELEPIGEGGNGLVYKGTILDKPLAVKILGENDRDSKIGRFKAEYFNVSMLPQNPFTIDLYDFDVISIEENQYPLILMKLYEKSCKDLSLDSIDELKKFVDFLFKSMKFLHDNKIIHRDLKPENILIDEHNQYKISDFGISSFDNSFYPEFHKTKKGERLANYDFSAPECYKKDAVTAETMDIYSIGQLIQWSVFKSTNKGTNRKKISSSELANNVESNKTYLNMLDIIVDKCIRHDFTERFQSIDEIQMFINQFQVRKVEIDPFDEMRKLQDMVTDVYPEAYNSIVCVENEQTISEIINNIDASKFSNNSFWFSYGTGTDNIKEIKYLGNRCVSIDNSEIFVKKIWLSLSGKLYDDLIILEVEHESDKIEPFIINGQPELHVVEIDNEILVSASKAESGNVRHEGVVLKLSEHSYKYRNRYNTYKYYAIGTQWSNVLQSESDMILDQLQRVSEPMNEQLVEHFRKRIFHNRNEKVRIRL